MILHEGRSELSGEVHGAGGRGIFLGSPVPWHRNSRRRQRVPRCQWMILIANPSFRPNVM